MMRAMMIWSLPCARYLSRIPLLERLLLYAYSPSVPLGRNSQIWGLIYDPDLTTIGDNVVVGGEASLSAHALTTKPDGTVVYLSASIHVGPRAVIGASARVALGAQIGADSIVLPGSNVLPFTTIPENQVWGGNPAVFLRFRDPLESGQSSETMAEAPKSGAPVSTALRLHIDAEQELVDDVRRLVADALDLPRERVSANFACEDCAEWDSLGQMAIAAAMFNRFGLTTDSRSTFCLRSISDLCRAVRERADASVGATEPVSEEVLPRNPELLPLLETATATRLLAQHADATFAATRQEVDVVVAATFTADPLAPALSLWTRAFGIKARTQMLGFDQVQQSLLDPESALRTNPGLNLVLARPEDLLADDESTTNARVEALLNAIDHASKNSRGPLAVATLPPVVSELRAWDTQAVARLRSRWNTRIAEHSEVQAIDLSGLVERIGVDAARAHDMEIEARSPYSGRLYQELAREAARLIRKRYRPPAKVIALDADNTLWGGVVAEDGANRVQVGADSTGRAFQLFQASLLKLRERGVLLVVVSRNEPGDVWSVFDSHPGMALERSHITAARMNWNPKSENLRDLAAELNLGLDSFVFIDDDPAQRMEVEANLPEVTVLPMPANPAEYCGLLNRLWLFDAADSLTAEDRERAGMMQQEQRRKQSLETHANLDDYLRGLELSVEMREATAFDLPRVAQLEQKTNQFNLSLRRRTLDELKTLSRKNLLFVVSAHDRFGDYGLIGSCLILPHDREREAFVLDSLVLSCRSLGRGIEDAVLSGILREVRSRGGKRLLAPYVAGPRNQPVLSFLRNAGFAEGAGRQFTLDVREEDRFPEHIDWVVRSTRRAG
jgi:FkbH-like protein